MNGALVVLAVNVAVGSLFAAGYAIIAFAARGQRAALWFSTSYLIGMVSPAADFMVPIAGHAAQLEWVSYTCFLLATLSISITFNLYNRRRPPWTAIAAICTYGIAARAAIWSAPSNSLLFHLVYQSAYVMAAMLSVRTVMRIDRRPLALLLAGTFAALGLNFASKPLLVLAFGSGRTLADYTTTTYALLSQSSTGILLLAAGLVLLLVVAQKAIAESERESDTDPLSGLLNRRGLERQARAALARAAAARRPVAAMMFDLDHFKQINDGFGHAEGDAVIARFAQLLRRQLPPDAVIARMGGEEFAALIHGADLALAGRYADLVCQAARDAVASPAAATTVSGGVAQSFSGEPLPDLLRRADQAAYHAKCAGRDCIVRAELHGELRPVPGPLLRAA